jgi:hypothetical protein
VQGPTAFGVPGFGGRVHPGPSVSPAAVGANEGAHKNAAINTADTGIKRDLNHFIIKPHSCFKKEVPKHRANNAVWHIPYIECESKHLTKNQKNSADLFPRI